MAHGKKFVDEPMMDPQLAKKGFQLGVALAVIGLGAAFASLLTGSKEQFYYSWIVAGMTFTTICLGCLFVVLVHHITGAMWSTTLRRLAENITSALPYMAVLMLPVLFIGMHDLYHWTHGDAVSKDAILQSKSGYLNSTFFVVRALIYFALWIVIARFYRKLSVK
jgi:hypothetical protein